jgi:large subunit ribosomal protein L33
LASPRGGSGLPPTYTWSHCACERLPLPLDDSGSALTADLLCDCTEWRRVFPLTPQSISIMQEQVTLECTEAKKEGKPASRYLTFRNKKTVTERIEKKKYNPFLRRHTLHKEIK